MKFVLGISYGSYIHRSRGGTEDGGQDLPGKLQVGIGILRNTATDPPLEAIGPTGSASRGMSVRPSVKYIDDLKKTLSLWTP